MILELIGHDGRFGEPDGLRHQLTVEITDADMTYLAGLRGGVESCDLVAQRHIRIGPMEQQQVNVVGAQFAETLVDRSGEGALGVVGHPHLGGQEEVRTVKPRCLNALANLLFISIDLGRVDMAEASAERRGNGPQHVLTRHPMRAEAEGGNLRAIGGDHLHGSAPVRGIWRPKGACALLGVD
jgi:hypothetical protein